MEAAAERGDFPHTLASAFFDAVSTHLDILVFKGGRVDWDATRPRMLHFLRALQPHYGAITASMDPAHVPDVGKVLQYIEEHNNTVLARWYNHQRVAGMTDGAVAARAAWAERLTPEYLKSLGYVWEEMVYGQSWVLIYRLTHPLYVSINLSSITIQVHAA